MVESSVAHYSSARSLRRSPRYSRRRRAPPTNKKVDPLLLVQSTGTPLVGTDGETTDMKLLYRELDNTALTTLGAMGNHAALQEMVKRHIMKTDGVSYEAAGIKFEEIERKNFSSEHAMALPFQIGIALCFGAGALSIPLVFHLPTVEYFNEHFVTAEHPPLKELETALEVGSWSWNWMEPVMGTATFWLLSMQYMRMHLQHLGVTPYTDHMKRFRGTRLADAYPQYNRALLFAYSESSPMYNPKDLWL